MKITGKTKQPKFTDPFKQVLFDKAIRLVYLFTFLAFGICAIGFMLPKEHLLYYMLGVGFGILLGSVIYRTDRLIRTIEIRTKPNIESDDNKED